MEFICIVCDYVLFREKLAKDGEVCERRQAVWHDRVQWVPADDEQAGWGRNQYGYFGGGF